MRASWRASLALAAALGVGAVQAPNYRVHYGLRLLRRAGPVPQLVATAVISGPPETALRLSLATPQAELHGLFSTLPEPDTVNLVGLFYGRRLAGRSRRGLPLWEEDGYRRWARFAWGGTARLDPWGPGGATGRRALWVEITVSREFAAGETRPSEEITVIDSSVAFSAAAVVPPRRVAVHLALVRGDTASSTRALDLVPETSEQRVTFVLGRETLAFDVTLERPDPPLTARDSALAVDADVVCLRLVGAGAAEAPTLRCGRLDNVARRIALPGGDTLVATFGWPGAR